jgi:hypothetical protein
MDFVHYQLATGRKLRILTIVDTFSCFSPALEPRFTFRGADVVEVPKESAGKWASRRRSGSISACEWPSSIVASQTAGFWSFSRWIGKTDISPEWNHQTALHGLTELACRHHHDLDLVIGRGEFGFNGRPRWRIARRYPGIPDRVHLREIRHVRDPNIGRE